MILKVHHSTKYSYTESVKHSLQILRLTPISHNRQKVINWELKTPGLMSNNIDWFGNITHVLTLPEPCDEIEIIALGKVRVFSARPNPILGPLHPTYYLRNTPLTAPNEGMKELAHSIKLKTRGNLDDTLTALNKLSEIILNKVKYVRGKTNSSTVAHESFDLGSGVCQDHSHIFLGCARFLGIPARYVSGYLHTDDTSHLSSHAWAEVWVNQAWHSFDISNQCQSDEKHIELAYGLDYLDACPIRGSRIGGGAEQLMVFSLVTDQQEKEKSRI